MFRKYAARTPIIHLHGIEGTRDHLPVDRLSGKNLNTVMNILNQFQGVVSIEVFSYEYLTASLEFLEVKWAEKSIEYT